MPAVRPPVAPMLARLERDLPVGEDLLYEPKWDGFRCLIFRRGQEISLESRNERPLTRYFPELMTPLRRGLPEECVIDGEIVIAGSEGLDFDALLQRIHPAKSRIDRLAAETPASFVAFDLLGVGPADLRGAPFGERRALLVEQLQKASPPVYLTPATTDPELARDWFTRFEGAGLDGVMAKDVTLPYRAGERVMVKVKHERTADCVVGGFRWHKQSGVGSLLLGLFDSGGTLRRVGVCAAFTAKRRQELIEELAPYRLEGGAAHPWLGGDGGPAFAEPANRWNQGRDTSWEALRPELVCEVTYDHLQGDRFRHATSFRRWRPDRRPDSCTYVQLDTPVPAELRQIFSS